MGQQLPQQKRQLINVTNGITQVDFTFPLGTRQASVWSPSRRYFAVQGGLNEQIYIADALSGQVQAVLETPSNAWLVAWAPSD